MFFLFWTSRNQDFFYDGNLNWIISKHIIYKNHFSFSWSPSRLDSIINPLNIQTISKNESHQNLINLRTVSLPAILFSFLIYRPISRFVTIQRWSSSHVGDFTENKNEICDWPISLIKKRFQQLSSVLKFSHHRQSTVKIAIKSPIANCVIMSRQFWWFFRCTIWWSCWKILLPV